MKLLTAGGAGTWWLVYAIIATVRFGEENRKQACNYFKVPLIRTFRIKIIFQ